MQRYDFIIAGGGMAGLSLAYYLTQSSLRDRSILILDRDTKDKNDRTWCFWEKGAGPFESIIFRQWDTVDFFGTTLTGPLDLGDYTYKMLRGIDFYTFMQQYFQQFPNIEFLQATINRVADTVQGGFVIANDEPYIADYVFDSTYTLRLDQPEHHNLLQHFKGWVIAAEKACFDVNHPRMMDFRTNQQDDCRFFYVLPFDERTALVEYTIFNDSILAESDYTEALQKYISQFLDTGEYKICETEFGVIPMSDEIAPDRPATHLVRIGTSGGYTKPSTGYTFQRTQRYLRGLVDTLAATGQPERPKSKVDSWFKGLLDSVFLNVLQEKRHPADDIFTRLYQRNKPRQIFRFLDEDTTFWEDLRIMRTVPLGPFLAGMLAVVRKRLF